MQLDECIGARIRAAREAAKLTQRGLAAEIGVTYQQVQKYESGKNRMSAGALVSAARATGRPVMFFFGGVDDQHASECRVIELWRAADEAGRTAIMSTAAAVGRGAGHG